MIDDKINKILDGLLLRMNLEEYDLETRKILTVLSYIIKEKRDKIKTISLEFEDIGKCKEVIRPKIKIEF